MCSRIAARRESKTCETGSSVAARSDAASALLCSSSQLRTFGSASKVINSWICFGDASSLLAGLTAFCAAAKPLEGEIVRRAIAARHIADARLAALASRLQLYIGCSPLPAYPDQAIIHSR